MMWRLGLWLLMILWLGGCVTGGGSGHGDPLRIGQREADLVARKGQPQEVQPGPGGGKIYVYTSINLDQVAAMGGGAWAKPDQVYYWLDNQGVITRVVRYPYGKRKFLFPTEEPTRVAQVPILREPAPSPPVTAQAPAPREAAPPPSVKAQAPAPREAAPIPPVSAAVERAPAPPTAPAPTPRTPAPAREKLPLPVATPAPAAAAPAKTLKAPAAPAPEKLARPVPTPALRTAPVAPPPPREAAKIPAVSPQPEARADIEAATRLELNMTKEQVRQLLGLPERTEGFRAGGKVVIVWFFLVENRQGRRVATPLVFENGRLSGWGENLYRRLLREVSGQKP